MCTAARMFWFFTAVLFSFQIGIASAEEKRIPPHESFSGVEFERGLLNVSVENQKFERVMDEVAQKTGIQIVIKETIDEDLTIDFDDLPLEEGLKRLLRGRSSVFVYHPGNTQQSSRLEKVLVFPGPWGGAMAGLVKMAGKRSTDEAEETADAKETPDQTQERLDQVLERFSQNETDLRGQFYDALEKLQEMDGFAELTKIEDDGSKALSPSGAEAMEKIYEALKGIPELEKVITDYSR